MGGRVEGGVTGFGMDIVRGLSGFGESEMSCGPCDSDLNNFCCMLRTLVAMMVVPRRTQHAFAMVLHPVDDVVVAVLASIRSAFTGDSIIIHLQSNNVFGSGARV